MTGAQETVVYVVLIVAALIGFIVWILADHGVFDLRNRPCKHDAENNGEVRQFHD